MFIQFRGIPQFQKEIGEYADQWEAISEKAIAAFMAETGLVFQNSEYLFEVTDVPAYTQSSPNELRLPATHVYGTRMGVLMRKLALILLEENNITHADVDQNRIVNLFLYDVMLTVLGRFIADYQVKAESERTGKYDYAAAWGFATDKPAMTRYKLMSRIVRDSRRTPAAV